MRTLLPTVVGALLFAAAASAEPDATPAPPAARAGVLVRAEDAAAQELAASFEARLAAALIAQGVDVADPSALFPPPPPASLEEGDQLFAEGKEAYNNLDPETAAKKLNDAALLYSRHPADLDPEKLARTYIFLGAVTLLNGSEARAADAFRRALTLSPQIEPESDLFGPDVHALFRQTRAGMDRLLQAELEIASEPSGARVQLDGRDVGLTPVPARTVPIGRHLVVVRRPGYVPFGAFPEIAPDGPTRLRPQLEPTAGMAQAQAAADRVVTAAAFGAPELPEGARALAQQLGSRFLVVARVSGSASARSAQLQAWDLTTGNKLVGVAVDLSGDDWRTTSEAASQVARWLSNPPPAQERRVAFSAPPLLKKWWFWAAVGGAAAAAAGVAVVSQGGGHRPDLVLGLP